MREITIGHKKIGKDNPPFIIAEMSGNHNQSLDRALQIVEAAAEAGADALKIQTYTADTMTISSRSEDFVVSDNDSPWHNQSLHDLYQQAYTPWVWHQAIFDRCHELGMIGFSSPFDESAVDFLETLQVPCYKIASFECTDLPLIKKVASTKKPMIISTGMCSVSEIDETVQTAKNAGCEDIILLKCTSTYPASPKYCNLNTIPNMQDTFQCQVGLSDHTLGAGVAIASVALGASVIEKHLTLSRKEGGVDASFSLEPEELKSLVKESIQARKGMGTIHYGPTDTEKNSLRYRRSIYITKNIKKGERLTKKNLRIIRPGYGLAPKYFDVVLGKRVNQKITKGTALKWNLIE
ncbi:pseudaminic acid synthase [Gracilibacillus kekensis]|uniref:Pseudaminic acid synthase n=1 Tax=Gracilibacillus kekensis TaxID=1027249 RepID=A0A1M7NTM4_9BACI|nr:pseudaminic acid synthase [Gracilibacillus kekensis]SHN07417.1 pseudaminic acid synthase [Gracilibacillus kekensis]